MPGQVYLIQPTILIGTKRYKIGRSGKSTLSRLKSYGKGTRCMRVYECNNPKTVEKQLIKNFRKRFNRIDDTNEYFVGDEGEMIILFDNIYNEFSTNKKLDKKRFTKIPKRHKNPSVKDKEILLQICYQTRGWCRDCGKSICTCLQDRIKMALLREKVINDEEVSTIFR